MPGSGLYLAALMNLKFHLASGLALACLTTSLRANPEIARAVQQSFGSTVAESIVLLKGSGTAGEPAEWTAYARDSFRPQHLLRIRVRQESGSWQAAASGAGTRVLDKAPPAALDFKRLRYRSADARIAAAKSAALAQATFASIDYQLAANAQSGTPEWGMALKDATGYEVGFVIVSGETGAISYQDWTPRVPGSQPAAAADSAAEGERAAKAVKRAARKAWEWTDNARKETGGFFRELFR